MHLGPWERLRGRAAAWALWSLPRWLQSYIAAVVVADLAIIGLTARIGLGSGRDMILFGAFLACNAATVEFTKRAGENAGLIRDVHGVWELPVAILLPPLYALILPVLRVILVQWRVRRIVAHRRVFTAAVLGLSYGLASLTYHSMTGYAWGSGSAPVQNASLWVLAVAVAGVVQWFVNTALVMTAVKGSDPTVSLLGAVTNRETAQNDTTELCVAVLVALGVGVTPLTIIFALPFVTLLQRSFRHAQLVNASRMDSKTGLLNAGTWEREAASEVARAVRTRSQLAVALIDVDHFKLVNDRHGHLAGDKALQAVARTLTVFLREYDLVGRFGGEEFSLLLPQTRAVDAYRIAERIRSYIGSMPIDVGGNERSSEPVKVTVSIGVAALGTKWDATAGSSLTDLLAAADRALYQAKQGGRDQVCVITENATIATLPAAQDTGRQASSPSPARAPADSGVPAQETAKAEPGPPALPTPLTPAAGQPGN